MKLVFLDSSRELIQFCSFWSGAGTRLMKEASSRGALKHTHAGTPKRVPGGPGDARGYARLHCPSCNLVAARSARSDDLSNHFLVAF